MSSGPGAWTEVAETRVERVAAAAYPWITRASGAVAVAGGASAWADAASNGFLPVAAAGLAAVGGALLCVWGWGRWSGTAVARALAVVAVAASVWSLAVEASSFAVGLLLGGAALLALTVGRARVEILGQLLALGIVLIAVGALVANAYGVAALVERSAPMASGYALTLLVLAVGLLAVRPDVGPIAVVTRADDMGGYLARRLLPAAILVPFIFGWLWREGRAAGVWGATPGLAMIVVASAFVLSIAVWWSAYLAHGLDARRRGAEERLRRNEKRLRTTMDALPIGVWFFDETGHVVYGNPAARRIWGGARMVGIDELDAYKGWWPETGRRIVAEEWAATRAMRNRETSIDEEVEIESFDGMRKMLRNSAVPLIGPDGALQGVVVLNEDITERKRTESAHERARAEAERRARDEEALRLATEAVSAAFTVEGVIDRIVRGALEATSADSSLIERIDGHGEDAAAEEAEVVAVAGVRRLPIGARVPYRGSLAQQVIERGEPLRIDDLQADPRVPPHLKRSCGRCSALAVPMVDPVGPIGALLLMRELDRPTITEEEASRAVTFANLASLAFRKAQLLEDAQRKSEALQRVLDRQARLVRGFSHDVKNPLGAADGHLALLEEGVVDSLTERQKEGVARVRRSIGAALRLIDSLVEFARAEAGQIRIRSVAVDVRRLADDIVEEHRATAMAKGIELRLVEERAVGCIRSDPDRIRQILGNLVSNAIKYTERGAITVRLESGRAEREGGAPGVVVAVVDTGPGIPPDRQADVFEEFIRLEEADDGRGAGLGLAISRRLARLLGGDVILESEPGKGSTFTLWLPAGVEAEAPRP